MRMFRRATLPLSLLLTLVSAVSLACSGREGSASAASAAAAEADPYRDARPLEMLEAISPAIPVFPLAEYSPDLTRQDNMNASRIWGADSEVWTFVTANSYPKVFHYYTNWLGMFRAFDAPDSIPDESETLRTYQVNLNDAMQQPFVPGDEIEPGAHRVLLELAETDTRTHTVIRYIIVPTMGPADGRPAGVPQQPPPGTTTQPAAQP